jgi:DNA-binding transcriptional LysR family regulator
VAPLIGPALRALAVRRLAAEAGIGIPAGDVCVEFPSVLALVAAGRGAAIVPRLALGNHR